MQTPLIAERGFSSLEVFGGKLLSRDTLVRLGRLAQYIAAAPDGLDVVLSLRSVGELLAQLADEDVDDFQLRLIHSAVEMIEEHLLGQRRAFAQREQFQHLVFFASQMHALL